MNKAQAYVIREAIMSVLEEQELLADEDDPRAGKYQVMVRNRVHGRWTVHIQKLVRAKGDVCEWETMQNIVHLKDCRWALKYNDEDEE